MRFLVVLLALCRIASGSPLDRIGHEFEPREYRVRIGLADPRFTGHVEIDGDLKTSTIWLHAKELEISRAVAIQAGRRIQLVVETHAADQRIGLSADPPLAPGYWTVEIDYRGPVHEYEGKRRLQPDHDLITHGVFKRVVAGRTYFFTQSEPTGAREIVPCIDEPDRKVPWQVTVDAPATGIALGNAPLVKESRIDAYHLRFEFAKTPPLPSYLVAFAAGAFNLIDAGATRGGAPIRIAVMHGDASHLDWATAIPRERIAALEDYLDVPFPYAKLDLISVPMLGLGAMENAGLITFDAATIADHEGWARIVGHELGHQWFGNLVTFAWWDDVWLAEAFAAWVPVWASHSVREQALLNQAASRHHRALHFTVTPKTMEAFDVDYSASIVGALAAFVGAEPFRRALHRYLVEHAQGSAVASDLFAALDAEATTPLAPWLMGLLDEQDERGVGVRKVCVHGAAEIEVSGGPHTYPLPVCFSYGDKGARTDRCVMQQRDVVHVPIAKCPTWLLPATGGDPLYRVEDTGGLALTDAWTWLTAAERRFVYRQLDGEPEQQLPMVPLLLNDPLSQWMIVNTLTRVRSSMSTSQHDELDTWIVKSFGALAGTLSPSDVMLSTLLAKAGEPTLLQRAVEGAKGFPDIRPEETYAFVIMADRNRKFAALLLDSLANHEGPTRDPIVYALESSPFTLELLIAEPDKAKRLHAYELLRVLSASCDATTAKGAIALAPELIRDKATKTCASRIERAARVDAAVHALVTSTH